MKRKLTKTVSTFVLAAMMVAAVPFTAMANEDTTTSPQATFRENVQQARQNFTTQVQQHKDALSKYREEFAQIKEEARAKYQEGKELYNEIKANRKVIIELSNELKQGVKDGTISLTTEEVVLLKEQFARVHNNFEAIKSHRQQVSDKWKETKEMRQAKDWEGLRGVVKAIPEVERKHVEQLEKVKANTDELIATLQGILG